MPSVRRPSSPVPFNTLCRRRLLKRVRRSGGETLPSPTSSASGATAGAKPAVTLIVTALTLCAQSRRLMNDGTADLAGERCARTPVPAANCELSRPDPLGGPRLAPDTVRRHEPAYPLGPRFAGPRQGLAGGCAPSDPPTATAHPGRWTRRVGADPRQRGGARRVARQGTLPRVDAVGSGAPVGWPG